MEDDDKNIKPQQDISSSLMINQQQQNHPAEVSHENDLQQDEEMKQQKDENIDRKNDNSDEVAVVPVKTDEKPLYTFKDKVLMFSGSVCIAIVLHTSGQLVINSYLPSIMADVISDPLLAQIIGTIPMI